MKKIIIITFTLSLYVSITAHAGDALKWQRQQFQQALIAIETNNWDQVLKYTDDLQAYPLVNYLQYRYLQTTLHQHTNSRIKKFIDNNKFNFMGKKINYAWLSHLIKNKDWQALELAYTPQKSKRLQCYALVGRLQQIQAQPELTYKYQQQIIQQAKKLWLVGKSQHSACDPVFEYLEQQQAIDDNLIWQRLNLAIKAKKTKLARYLGTKLKNGEHRQWADYLVNLPTSPHSLLKKIYLKPFPKQINSSEIISYTIQKLARKQADQAAQHWQKFQTKLTFSPSQQQKTSADIAMYSYFQKRQNTLTRLKNLSAAAHNKSTEQLLIQSLLVKRDWQGIKTAINKFNITAQKRQKWRYWLARALEQQGQATKANKYFQALAQERDFYGYLSAERLQLPYATNHKATLFNPTVKQQLYQQAPELAQALEFKYFNLIKEANMSWNAGLKRLNKPQIAQAAALARSWRWYDKGIITAAKAQAYDDVEVRFPLAYHALISAAAKEQNIDEAWVYGIIRQESAFMNTVTSHVGARGLMQLMPKTQAMMAKKIDLKLEKNQIFDSGSNIRLGTAYLKHLLDKFAGSYLLATAGYNAGPGRAQRWWKNNKNIEADIWVELIPFKETRRYVKRVMLYTALYEHQLGREIQPLHLNFPKPRPPKTMSAIDHITPLKE